MNRKLALLALLGPWSLVACGGEAGAAGRALDATAAATSIEKLLNSVTDAQSAAAARAQLEPWLGKLDVALTSMRATLDAAGDKVGEWSDKAMAVLEPQLDRLLQGLRQKVEQLRQDPQVREAMGTTLDRLAGLLGK
jgi:hypothetical protein